MQINHLFAWQLINHNPPIWFVDFDMDRLRERLPADLIQFLD